MSIDANDGSLDGLEDSDATAAADANRPYGEVTAEDLGTDDLVHDGADAAGMVPDHPDVAVDTASTPTNPARKPSTSGSRRSSPTRRPRWPMGRTATPRSEPTGEFSPVDDALAPARSG